MRRPVRRSRCAARPSSANGGSSTAPSPTAWRKPATGSSPSPVYRRASGVAPAPRMRSNDCTRSSSEGSRRRACCRPRTPLPCCSGHCSPLARSTCAKLMAGRRSPQNPSISQLTSQPETVPSCYRRSRHAEFQPHPGRQPALIRKILSTVVIRDEFLFERGDRMQEPVRARRFRARKRISHIYTGAHSLFAICEGNPRWIIGLLRPLISDFAFNSDRLHLRTIGRALQAKRIERTVSTLIVLLSTLRVEEPVGKSVSIIELIETLGDSCFEQVLGPEFNVEPRLSFVIDEDVQPAVLSAVGRAINQGALVLVPRNLTGTRGKALVTTDPRGINGRRVRLTFLFAPRYRLPLVLGRSVDRECPRFC